MGGISTAFGWAGEGWLIKTDSQGNVIWQNGYHGEGSTASEWDYISDVVEINGIVHTE